MTLSIFSQTGTVSRHYTVSNGTPVGAKDATPLPNEALFFTMPPVMPLAIPLALPLCTIHVHLPRPLQCSFFCMWSCRTLLCENTW